MGVQWPSMYVSANIDLCAFPQFVREIFNNACMLFHCRYEGQNCNVMSSVIVTPHAERVNRLLSFLLA